MQTEIKTRHGLATITAPNEMTPEQLAATEAAVEAVDDLSWRCGAASASLSADDAAIIKWRCTSPSHAVLDGRRFDMRQLDAAIEDACTMDCELYRAGRCSYSISGKHRCPRVLSMLDDAEADDQPAAGLYAEPSGNDTARAIGCYYEPDDAPADCCTCRYYGLCFEGDPDPDNA